MDWSSLSDWGSLASLAGVLVAAVGLGAVGYQVRGAKRSVDQTRKTISDVLTFGSGNRASTMIQELKLALHKGRWEVGYHQCHALRTLLGDLTTTGLSSQHTESISEAMLRLTGIENDLEAALRKNREPRGANGFNAALSTIQLAVENILSEATSKRGGQHE